MTRKLMAMTQDPHVVSDHGRAGYRALKWPQFPGFLRAELAPLSTDS